MLRISLQIGKIFLQAGHHRVSGSAFPISQYLTPLFNGTSDWTMVFVERFCWWFHIIRNYFFLNIYPYSKHFHILLAFPNTFFSNLKPKGIHNLSSVTNEVKAILDPSLFLLLQLTHQKFGAKDVHDLSWKQLMDAYSCTECEDVLRLVLQTLPEKNCRSKNYDGYVIVWRKLEKIWTKFRKILVTMENLYSAINLGEEFGVYVV